MTAGRGPLFAASIAAAVLLLSPLPSSAWGREGHEIIGIIAAHYLTPAARGRIDALLGADRSGLTRNTGIASESTWADRYRDSDRRGGARRYRRTREWHYVDIELAAPDLGTACFGRPRLAPGVPASKGPADDCIVDKVDEFGAELADPATTRAERLRALQFLLHFVGDLHQPLHCADDHDRGGNDRRVLSPARRAASLHQYWDTVFVEALGRSSGRVANRLIASISARQRRRWSSGAPADWAMQSFRIARSVAYGDLPAADESGRYRLDRRYDAAAINAVRIQLQRAGVRLALLLNRALTPQAPR